ncbi:hypothetical protein QBC46DRAFT_383034 [Diplogelasinospora grovesii]|uniref:Uncharacterized protein n=1 Tax=Diplogelasinospora grovesii TaxID=303347 RepID=A0AAN6NAB9_9PEZI|nr:hypothetical protein QBC46DRAFT_383034 [Diplogelasinospora grovesii]
MRPFSTDTWCIFLHSPPPPNSRLAFWRGEPIRLDMVVSIILLCGVWIAHTPLFSFAYIHTHTWLGWRGYGLFFILSGCMVV